MTTCCNPTTTSATECCKPDTTNPKQARKPRFAVTREDHAFNVRVDMPGVAKDGVSVDLDKDTVTISGKRSTTTPTDWKPLHSELTDSDYHLRLQLQSPVDTAALTARLDDGVLTLRLPLPEATKPRRVEVS